MSTRTCLISGAAGFIAGHLVHRLKSEGYWVRGVDQKWPEFRTSEADEHLIRDLRYESACRHLFTKDGEPIDEVYQLAADMGGMGFIHSSECECLRNNVLINAHMIDGAARAGVKRYFFSSSQCVYKDLDFDAPAMTEDEAYPAHPDNEYGWEKLYSERMAFAYARKRPEMKVRVARFGNSFGPMGTWRGGREKAPAAICRKVAEIRGDKGEIEVWGDGTAVRSFLYIDDLINGILLLMRSDHLDQKPANIGSSEYVSVDALVQAVAKVARKEIAIRHIDGPVGVRSRNFSNARIESCGWRQEFTLLEGIFRTYPWIMDQVNKARK